MLPLKTTFAGKDFVDFSESCGRHSRQAFDFLMDLRFRVYNIPPIIVFNGLAMIGGKKWPHPPNFPTLDPLRRIKVRHNLQQQKYFSSLAN